MSVAISRYMSPALILTPKDWGSQITISGFYYLPLASSFIFAADLAAFLDSGPPPVYARFRSSVLEDPEEVTNFTIRTIQTTGQRALFARRWGGFAADEMAVPERFWKCTT